MTTVAAPQLPPAANLASKEAELVARAVPCIDDVTQQITQKIEQLTMQEGQTQKKNNKVWNRKIIFENENMR